MTTHLHRATQSNKKWGGIQREAQMGTSPRKHKNPKWISFQSGPFIFYFVFFFSKWFAMASPNWSKRRTGMPRDFHHLLFHSRKNLKTTRNGGFFFEAASPIPNWKKKWSPSPHHHDQNETSTTTTTTIYYLLYYYETLLSLLFFFFLSTTNKPYIENNLSRPCARAKYGSNYRTHSQIVFILFYFLFLPPFFSLILKGLIPPPPKKIRT